MSKDADAIDLARAFLLSQASPSIEPKSRVTRANNRTSKPKVSKHAMPSIVCETSMNAWQFLIAMRDAGTILRTNSDGKIMRVTDTTRKPFDEAYFIAKYTGQYFASENHGTQCDMARLKAQGEINPAKESPRIDPSIAGYVAGSAGPNKGSETKKIDLLARKRCAENKAQDLDTESLALERAGNFSQARFFQALVTAERERIAHICQQLDEIA